LFDLVWIENPMQTYSILRVKRKYAIFIKKIAILSKLKELKELIEPKSLLIFH
jgi:hypothetical protein